MNTWGFRWHYKCLSLSQQLLYLSVVCWPCVFTASDSLPQLCWWSHCVPGNEERRTWKLCSSSETERESWRTSWRLRGRTERGRGLLSQKRRRRMNKGLQRWETLTILTACKLDSAHKTILRSKRCVLTRSKFPSNSLSLYKYVCVLIKWSIKFKRTHFL